MMPSLSRGLAPRAPLVLAIVALLVPLLPVSAPPASAQDEVAEADATVRVIHASPDAGVIDVGVEGSEANLFEGVDFRNTTDYIVVDAGDYALQVRPGGEDMTMALQSDATLEEGVTYDLVALGRPDDQILTLLALMAAVEIQTGDIATPEAIDDEASVAETVVPEPIEAVEASPTPTA